MLERDRTGQRGGSKGPKLDSNPSRCGQSLGLVHQVSNWVCSFFLNFNGQLTLPNNQPVVLVHHSSLTASINKAKTICLDFFFLPRAEMIGWHPLTALFMTCLVKNGSCIELWVSRGNSASLLHLALASNTAWCQTDHSQEDWPSSLAPGKKKRYLCRDKFFWLGGFALVGFQAHDPTFSTWNWAFATCHMKAKEHYYSHIVSRRSLSVEMHCTKLLR